jgi:hypothetical protein
MNRNTLWTVSIYYSKFCIVSAFSSFLFFSILSFLCLHFFPDRITEAAANFFAFCLTTFCQLDWLYHVRWKDDNGRSERKWKKASASRHYNHICLQGRNITKKICPNNRYSVRHSTQLIVGNSYVILMNISLRL